MGFNGSKFNGYGNKKPVVLLGGNMGDKDVSSEIAKSLKSLGFPFRIVDGVYKGMVEKSFVIPYEVDNNNDINTLIGISEHFNQESVLILDRNRNAKLFFIDGFKITKLGKFTPFTEKEFNLLSDDLKESYTFDGDYYYVCI